MPSFAEFQNLFDMYTIEKVHVTIRVPRCHQPATTSSVFPTLYWALDFNDGAAPVNLDEVLQYETCKIHQFAEGSLRSARWTFTPRTNVTTPTGTQLAPVGTWLPTSDANATWNGLKYAIVNWNTTSFNNTVVWLDVKVDFALKVAK